MHIKNKKIFFTFNRLDFLLNVCTLNISIEKYLFKNKFIKVSFCDIIMKKLRY